MNRRYRPLFLILAMLTATTARAEWRDGLNLDNADLSLFRMIMINEGQQAGTMEYGWTRIGNQYLVEDRTSMAPNILESASALIDAKTLLPYTVMVKFSMGDSMMNVDLRWTGGNRQGQIISRRHGDGETIRDVDLVEDNYAPLRMAAIGFVAALPLQDGYQTSFDWFNTMANRTEQVRVETGGRARVETPGGSIEAYKVALRGVMPENILYITTSKPRRIVRIDVVGRDMYFLRTADHSE
ncbi:DUF3108 domain-containing protein [Kordiimonas aestuarii]|uniref:DUF3108 domain-containing protein n=1 Tax=Kordiimonas aestuarii TaxID=1005925 RepID=UPI0021D0FEFD|nr:hypothetical protein [Kordiimonas aestuarii]